MSDLTLTADDATAVIATADGARVARLRAAGHELVGRGSDSPHGWGAFPMAPWAGRVRDGLLTWQGRTYQLPLGKPPHAIHGLVARREWQVLEASTSEAHLRCDLRDDWPWSGHVELRYRLAPDCLTTELSVHAHDTTMPAWSGIHPWFPRRLQDADDEPVEVRITLDAAAMLGRDDAGIATAEEVPVPAGAPMDTPVDDCFTGVRWPVTLTWPGLVSLEVSGSGTYAVVFTERDAAVAVEPQTAPPDATALGLAPEASPGHPHVLTTTWRWRSA